MPLIALALVKIRHLRHDFVWTGVDAGVLVWLAAVGTGGALSLLRDKTVDGVVLRDFATTLYLALLYFAIRVLPDKGLVDAAGSALVVGATLASALGAIGVVLSELRIDTPLALAADSPYPYLGSAARARALTATPNMLASILMLGLLLLAAGAAPRLGSASRLAAIVLSLGLALTFSKTAVPLAAGLAVVWMLRCERSSALARIAVAISWLAAATVFGVFSHVVVLCGDADRERLEQAMFIAGERWGHVDLLGRRCDLYPTNYSFNKKASLIAVERSWPWGIGPGRHPAFALGLQREGLYPKTQWLGTPHSSYTGAAAELGLLGILGLASFLGALALGIRDALRREATRPLGVAGAATLAALLIEAFATDLMHFRHYTWLAALVGSAAARSRD